MIRNDDGATAINGEVTSNSNESPAPAPPSKHRKLDSSAAKSGTSDSVSGTPSDREATEEEGSEVLLSPVIRVSLSTRQAGGRKHGKSQVKGL
jgi:hypothetical protein